MALRPGELSARQAASEIRKILDRVPDSELPKPKRIEHSTRADGTPVDVAWWDDSHGSHIQPITTSPAGRRTLRRLVQDAVEDEWLHRERTRRYGEGYEFRDGKQINPVERAS